MPTQGITFNYSTPLEIITPSEDAVIKEVSAVLREWLELWKKLFLVRGKKLMQVRA